MKKIFSIFLLISLFSFGLPMFAMDKSQVEQPKWEDYVPEKYQNPNEDRLRTGMFVQVILGTGLTVFILPSPWSIPMLCRGITNIKHVSYYNKKEKFMVGLNEAEKIDDPKEREIYYKKLLKSCNLKENKRVKKEEKENKKLEKIKREIESTKV